MDTWKLVALLLFNVMILHDLCRWGLQASYRGRYGESMLWETLTIVDIIFIVMETAALLYRGYECLN